MFWPIQPLQSAWRRLAGAVSWRIGEAAARGIEAAWRRDPLAHPALRGMSQRALGDLPFDPTRVDPE